MKLQKALKLRKKLAGEINHLKSQIISKNSYPDGSRNPHKLKKYDVRELYNELTDKINELVGLKFAINEANLEIQSKIYLLAECKGLVDFWRAVNVTEGEHPLSSVRFGGETVMRNHIVAYDEKERDEMIKTLEEKIDALQDEIDTYNFTTEIPWDEPEVPEEEKKEE